MAHSRHTTSLQIACVVILCLSRVEATVGNLQFPVPLEELLWSDHGPQKGNESEQDSLGLFIRDQVNRLNLHSVMERIIDEQSFENRYIQRWLSPIVGVSNITVTTQSNVSSECLHQLTGWISNMQRLSGWALKMLDSWGKIQAGVLSGRLQWLGSFRECYSVQGFLDDGQTGLVKGRYCSLESKLHSSVKQYKFNVFEGICVPDACHSKDIQVFVDVLLHMTRVDKVLLKTHTTCKNAETTFTNSIIIFFVIFLLLLLLAFTATLVDLKSARFAPVSAACDIHADNHDRNGVVNGNSSLVGSAYHTVNARDKVEDERSPFLRYHSNQKKRRIGRELLLSFSLKSNWSQLFCLKPQQGAGFLTCLEGIRTITLVWIIYEHVLLNTLAFAENTGEFIKDGVTSLWTPIVSNGTVSCDTFFTMSSLVLTYSMLKSMNECNGKVKWFQYYVNRYFRLTPLMIFVVMFYWKTFPSWASGPWWLSQAQHEKHCYGTWWRDLLYMNNFLGGCYHVTWYLAVDMQLYLISPIFLLALYRKPAVGICLLTVCTLASISYTLYLSYTKHLTHVLVKMKHRASQKFFRDQYYVLPWCRAPPYLIGMVMGYVLHRTRMKISINWKWQIFGWIIFILIHISNFYSVQHAFVFYPDYSPLSPAENSAYISLTRPAWSLGVCWVIVICVTGNAGVINSFLSLPIWAVGGRLSYAGYLTHLFVVFWYLYSRTKSVRVDYWGVLIDTSGILLITFFISVFLTLLIEMPLKNILGLLLKK
ncbi:O-acyltransferase like protein-like [Aplysia californica]|uniref:O-acyltransferase like protein-like n=1 Tax=Aplysia californica TaxID=6500 RepID=A0ABM1A5K0_APLCA|nr:O-acyltransferase like protein-like [Aplysia californica]